MFFGKDVGVFEKTLTSFYFFTHIKIFSDFTYFYRILLAYIESFTYLCRIRKLNEPIPSNTFRGIEAKG